MEEVCAPEQMELVDLVVVGAGLSGLSLAHRLLKKKQGASVVILEATDRIGGRVKSTEAGIDLGPAWIWVRQNPRMAALCKYLGVKLSPQPGTHAYEGQMRAEGGIGAVTDALHRRIVDLGGQIRTETPVKRITQAVLHPEGERVVVVAEGCSEVFSAKAVVVTAPPRVVLKTMVFNPALPAGRVRAMEGTPGWMTKVSKVAVKYDTRTWDPEDVFGGASIRGPGFQFYDASTPAQAAVVAFCQGADLSDDAMVKAVSRQVAHLIRSHAEPQGADVARWERSPYTNEDPSDPDMFHLSPNRVLSERHGRVLFSGTEAALANPGYLEGAIEASEHVLPRVVSLVSSS